MQSILSPDFWTLYSGQRAILGEALVNHDPYDQFGWCQGWRFALCDFLYWDQGETVPGFRPGFNGPDIDSFEYSQLTCSDYTTEQAEYALMILDRYREWLRIAGEDY
jgi:hypothetical protein